MAVDELGCRKQVVAHRLELLVGVLLEQARAFLSERRVVLAGLTQACSVISTSTLRRSTTSRARRTSPRCSRRSSIVVVAAEERPVAAAMSPMSA
jgi:hypothetical protein